MPAGCGVMPTVSYDSLKPLKELYLPRDMLDLLKVYRSTGQVPEDYQNLLSRADEFFQKAERGMEMVDTGQLGEHPLAAISAYRQALTAYNKSLKRNPYYIPFMVGVTVGLDDGGYEGQNSKDPLQEFKKEMFLEDFAAMKNGIEIMRAGGQVPKDDLNNLKALFEEMHLQNLDETPSLV